MIKSKLSKTTLFNQRQEAKDVLKTYLGRSWSSEISSKAGVSAQYVRAWFRAEHSHKEVQKAVMNLLEEVRSVQDQLNNSLTQINKS